MSVYNYLQPTEKQGEKKQNKNPKPWPEINTTQVS